MSVCPTGHFMPVIDTHAHRARAVSAFSQGIAEISQSSPLHTAAKVRRACTRSRLYRRRWWRSKRNSPAAFFLHVPWLWCSGHTSTLCACLVIMSLSLFCGNDRDHSTMKKSRKFYTTVHDWADFPLLGWAYILLYYCTGYVLYCKRDELFTMGPVLHTVLLLQLQRELMNKTNDQFGFRCHSIIAYLDVKSICLFKWAETHRRIQCKWSIVEKWQK